MDLDLEMVKSEQERDDDIQVIFRDLLEDEDSRPGFVLINGVLYRMAQDENGCSRLYFPKALIPEVLKLTLSHRLAGHTGIKKTKKALP